MKKLILSIGTTITAIAPIVAIASCTTTNNNNNSQQSSTSDFPYKIGQSIIITLNDDKGVTSSTRISGKIIYISETGIKLNETKSNDGYQFYEVFIPWTSIKVLEEPFPTYPPTSI